MRLTNRQMRGSCDPFRHAPGRCAAPAARPWTLRCTCSTGPRSTRSMSRSAPSTWACPPASAPTASSPPVGACALRPHPQHRPPALPNTGLSACLANRADGHTGAAKVTSALRTRPRVATVNTLGEVLDWRGGGRGGARGAERQLRVAPRNARKGLLGVRERHPSTRRPLSCTPRLGLYRRLAGGCRGWWCGTLVRWPHARTEHYGQRAFGFRSNFFWIFVVCWTPRGWFAVGYRFLLISTSQSIVSVPQRFSKGISPESRPGAVYTYSLHLCLNEGSVAQERWTLATGRRWTTTVG